MDNGIRIVMAGGAFLAWLAVLYKGIVLWRQPQNPSARAYWAGFLALAINLTIVPPSVASAIDRWIGLPNVSYLIADGAALLTCWSWLIGLHRLSLPGVSLTRHVRLLGWLVASTLAFMSVRFVLAPHQTLHQFGPSREAIYLGLYRLLMVGLIGLHMVWFIILLRRHAPTVPSSPLRVRLRLMTLAACAILGFAASETLRICRVPLPEMVSALLLLLGIALVVCSLTLAKPLYALGQWLRLQRIFRRLYPLWAALYPVKSAQSLIPPPARWRRWLPQRDVRFRVRRQVIEILDWELLLYPYQPGVAAKSAAEAARHAAPIGGAPAGISRAETLATTLDNWYQEQRSGSSRIDAGAFVPTFSEEDALPVAVDWESELRQLLQVADQFRGLPLVRPASDVSSLEAARHRR